MAEPGSSGADRVDSVPPGPSDRPKLASLRRNLALLLGVGASLLIVAAVGFGQPLMGPQPLRWLVLPVLLWAYIGVFTYQKLPTHRAGDGLLLGGLGPGLVLTLIRGLLLAGLAGFILTDPPRGIAGWLPAFLYTGSASLDYFDGYLARRSKMQSPLGERVDLELDALGILIAVIVAVRLGKLPPLFLLMGFGRYAFLWSQALLGRAGVRRKELPESLSRRPIAGFSMGFVSASLWPVVTPPAAATGGLLFLAAFLLSFTRDWLVTVGLLDPQSPGYQSVRRWTRHWFLDWFPLPARAALGLAAFWELTRGRAPMILPGFTGAASSTGAVIAVLLAVSSTLMVLGFLARSAAVLHFFPLALVIYAGGLTPNRVVLMIAAILVLMLGSGKYSLWDPERIAFSRRAGALPNGS